MGTFKKKPVEIQAVQFISRVSADPSGFEFAESVPAWLRDGFAKHHTEPGSVSDGADGGLAIMTLEGEHLARPGDFIIRGVNGELYPCKPDIFAKTYDRVG